jgi:excinuclease ABC subunit B
VAILDADKEGYLRSATSLIQTAGRAARHLHGEVILYADVMTQSIQKFLATAEYRRQKQIAYNEEHHITPRSVTRPVEESLSSRRPEDKAASVINDAGGNFDVTETIRELEEEMVQAASNLEFEKAALLRDQIKELKRGSQSGSSDVKASAISQVTYPRGKRQKRLKAP